MMKSLQEFAPIHVVNEHNEAFFFWHQARIEGRLTGAIDLFHVDAHDDMGRPSRFRQSVYFRAPSRKAELEFYYKFASSELTIENFIFPAVLGGLIRNVYFIVPKWRKFNSIRKKFSICSAFGEGEVLKYSIMPDAGTNPMVKVAYPDLKQFNFIAASADKLPRNRKVILDIDMDYFACRDSIQNYMSFELEITPRQFESKEAFLEDKAMPFSGFEFKFIEREGRFFAIINRKKGKDVSHLPSEEEIEREIDELVEHLVEKGIRPEVVTLCRSCHSGYCPEEYGRFIEPLLLEKLQKLGCRCIL